MPAASSEPSPSSFDAYLKGLASLTLMTAEQEREQAKRISDRRHERWMAILSAPHFVDGIIELAKEHLPKPVEDEQLYLDVSAAARAVRRRRTKANLAAAKEANSALTESLCTVDRDQVVADMICADLDALDAGDRRSMSLRVTLPRGRDATFNRYVDRVRRTTQSFWHARSAFVRANLRLVVAMARRYARGRMSMADLVQEGNIGLLQAVDRFDYARGFRFSTYAAWWIRHAINRAIQNKAREVRLPVHVLDALSKVSRAQREHETRHGVQSSPKDIAEKTGIPEKKIQRLQSRYLVHDNPVALDAPVPGSEDSHRIDLLVEPDVVTPTDVMTGRLTAETIEAAMDDLPEMERDILRLRFGLDSGSSQTLREIGERYSLSRERIRQLQERALGRIRDRLSEFELL